MGGRGPLPMDPKLRRRGNKPPEMTKLRSEAETRARRVPALPPRPKDKGPWSRTVREWWRAVHRSPMAERWLESDRWGILPHLASLHQLAHDAETADKLIRILSEIRHMESRLGLSPADRQRLLWEVPLPALSEEDGLEGGGLGRGPDETQASPGPEESDPRAAILGHAGVMPE